jgi:predicted metal-dependent HD superfamily phosphohydrolase
MSTEQLQARLRSRWHALAARLGFAQAASAALFDELARAYSQPGRHYHNLGHIAQLIGLLDQYGQDLRCPDAIELAIFFHDAVYVPIRSDNEAASAALARARLTALGAIEPLVREVERLILATRHGTAFADAVSDPDLALLLDLDLSVLGAERAMYAAYAAAIRREYAVVPDLIYRPGRRRVLAEFRARPRIYATPRLYEAWEGAARANLEWESAALTAET